MRCWACIRRGVEVDLPPGERCQPPRGTRIGRHGRRGGEAVDVDAASRDHDAALSSAARKVTDPFEHRRPHVQLDLLGEAQMGIQRVREAVSASCPRLDLEPQGAVVRASSELDLPGLQMPGERRQPKRDRGGGEDADGAVPGAGHPHEVLVPHGEAPLAIDLLERRELAASGCAFLRFDQLAFGGVDHT